MLELIDKINFTHVELIGHTAFLLIMCSFMAKKIWHLRMLSIVGSFCSIYYGINVAKEPLWVPVSWNFVFIGINIYHLVMIARERRTFEFEGDEKKAYENIFSAFLPGEFKKILAKSFKRETPGNQILFKKGEEIDSLFLIINGEVSVKVADKEVAVLKENEFVGEMSFLTDERTSADIYTKTDLTYFMWPKDSLKTLLSKRSNFQAHFHGALGRQLINKILSKSQ